MIAAAGSHGAMGRAAYYADFTTMPAFDHDAPSRLTRYAVGKGEATRPF